MTRVLVCGFYGHQNIGDQLFIDAFNTLFPSLDFRFTDIITSKHLEGIQYVFFGGGSFLNQRPNIHTDAYELLKQKTLCFIGVGAETLTHDQYAELIKQASLVALRSNEGLDKVRSLCPNKVITIPDLVFALSHSITTPKANTRSILVLPNISCVSRWDSKQWEHIHYQAFKCEFAQVLDTCVEDGYRVNFLSLCTHPKTSDNAAASEIINAMKWRDERYKIACKPDFASITETMSQYGLVITQRYHGIVLSEMLQLPYIAVCHHDKLFTASVRNGLFTNYYGLHKRGMLDLIDQANSIKFHQQPGTFDELIGAVNGIVV
jgi:polysaccharide pyruvyl transferase WcaK-like protein